MIVALNPKEASPITGAMFVCASCESSHTRGRVLDGGIILDFLAK